MTLSQIMLVAVLVQFLLALVVFVISVLILHAEASFIARVLRERGSDPLGPEFCAGHREVHSEA